MVLSLLHQTRSDCKNENLYLTGRRKEPFECWWVLYSLQHCVSSQGLFLSMLLLPRCFSISHWSEFRTRKFEESIRRFHKKVRDRKRLHCHEKCESGWWGLLKTTKVVNLCIRENFPRRRSLSEDQLLEKKERNSFSCVECDFQVPEKKRTFLSKFFSAFGNTLFSKTDLGSLMKKYRRPPHRLNLLLLS